MLNNLRNATNSWGMRIFLGIIVIAFTVFWTAGDAFHQLATGSRQVLATVGGEKILANDLISEIRRVDFLTKAQTGASPNMRALLENTLNARIVSKLIELETDKMGFTISNAQISEVIVNSKGFQDEQGVFSERIYKQYLQSLRYKEADFIQHTRNELRGQQLVQAFTAGMILPDAMLQPFMAWKFEKRDVALAELKYSDIKNVEKITEEELKSYYDGHHADFTLPERRDFSVILLTTEQLKHSLKLTREQEEAGFADYFATRDKASLPTKEESNKVLDELKSAIAEDKLQELSNKVQDDLAGGATLEEVAKTHDLKLINASDIRRDTKNQSNLDAEHLLILTQDGFSTSKGDSATTHEMQSGGYMFMQLNEIHAPKLQTLETVKSQVEEKARLLKQQKLAQEKADSIVQQVAEGKTLNNVAKTKRYTLDRESREKAIPASFQQQLFNTKLDTVVTHQAKDRILVAAVTKVIPADAEIIKTNKAKYSAALRALLTEDVLSALLMHLESKYVIERNPPAIKQMLQHLGGNE